MRSRLINDVLDTFSLEPLCQAFNSKQAEKVNPGRGLISSPNSPGRSPLDLQKPSETLSADARKACGPYPVEFGNCIVLSSHRKIAPSRLDLGV